MRETPKTDTTAHNEHKSEVQTEYIVEQQVKQTVVVAALLPHVQEGMGADLGWRLARRQRHWCGEW